ncbi:MAG: glycosyltransferase [Pseudomonadota bacterium]
MLALDVPVFGLCRTALGYLLVPGAALSDLRPRLAGLTEWGPVDTLGRLSRRVPRPRARAEADLRRCAVGRCLRTGLAALARRHLPLGTAYLNVGHSNLSQRTFAQLADAGLPIGVLVHDTIPLDHPQTQRPGTVDRFAKRMGVVERFADVIITTAAATQAAIATQLSPRKAQFVTAHLGVTLATPATATPAPQPPYFLCVGTIDPRKNQGLLLDVWEDLTRRMGPKAPPLVLAGSRGWGDAALMQRLDRLSSGPVIEMPGLTDAEMAGLLEGATALLHPSTAEGFGFPVIEAALRGIPIICHDLPVFRELVGDIPVYVSSTEMYHWGNAVDDLLNGGDNEQTQKQDGAQRPHHPTWDSHLATVLTAI